MNMVLHGVTAPNILRHNTLEDNIRNESHRFDVEHEGLPISSSGGALTIRNRGNLLPVLLFFPAIRTDRSRERLIRPYLELSLTSSLQARSPGLSVFPQSENYNDRPEWVVPDRPDAPEQEDVWRPNL